MAEEAIENQSTEESQGTEAQVETVDWEAKYKELQKESRSGSPAPRRTRAQPMSLARPGRHRGKLQSKGRDTRLPNTRLGM